MNKCPKCSRRIDPGIDECQWCGFSMATLDEMFGGDEVIMARIEDDQKCLRDHERADVLVAIEKFEKRFPQFFVAVFLGDPPVETDSTRLFGAWLLNRADVEIGEETRTDKENALLFVANPVLGEVSLTVGYHVESVLDDLDAQALLGQDVELLRSEDFGDYIVSLVGRIERHLIQRFRKQKNRKA